MEQIDGRFLEEYKRVDSFCKEAYGYDEGMTSYINIMKDIYGRSTWPDELREFIRLRGIRNKIAHESVYDHPTERDIALLREFHGQLINATDPLSIHRRESQRASAATKKKADNTETMSSGCLSFLICAGIIAAVAFILIYLIKY